jgi:hypothetical protein
MHALGLRRYPMRRLSVVAALLFGGCSALSSPTSVVPAGPVNHIPIELVPVRSERVLALINPDKRRKATRGIYGAQAENGVINGYPANNKKNAPPTCSLPANLPQDVAVDREGNLIDADSGSFSVIIYKGKGMCGKLLSSISDPYGQPADAVSANAATGTIVVGNSSDTSGPGSISLCTISHGCTKNLTNANMLYVASVALAKNGDCWASAENTSGSATLTYFKGCAGPGRAATGYENTSFGGLDVDSAGNIVAIAAFSAQLWIYKGCNPACTVVGGPYSLHGDSLYGHLNETSTALVAGDYQYGEVDVYKYATSGVTYQYSFNNGLSASDYVGAAAYNPGPDD